MKALKEKRIGLRSLLRRSLVILSLLALVFASCGDSSSDDNGGSGGSSSYDGPKIIAIELCPVITETQYIGTPVNMAGMYATLYYQDGTNWTDTNLTKFKADPPYVYGLYDNTGVFWGMRNVKITYSSPDGQTPTKVVAFQGDKDNVGTVGNNVWGVVRDPTDDDTAPDPIIGVTGSYAQGVQLTGISSGGRQRKAFADADDFDFVGLTLEADYDTPVGATGRYVRKVLDFYQMCTSWKIIPDYDNKDPATLISPGFVYVTVGENSEKTTGMEGGFMAWDSNGLGYQDAESLGGVYTKGITVKLPLDVVYTVLQLEISKVPELEPFGYWMDNTPEEWFDRVAGAVLDVSYRGTSEVHSYSIKELTLKTDVWYNENLLGQVINDPDEKQAVSILPLQYPYTTKANKDPGITIYYRGYTAFLPVDVYTKLMSVQVVSGAGTALEFIESTDQDNDRYEQTGTEEAVLAGLVVTATYQAYNNTELTYDFPLKRVELATSGITGDALTKPGPGLYTTDFKDVFAKLKAGKPVTEKSQAIKVYHGITQTDGNESANPIAAQLGWQWQVVPNSSPVTTAHYSVDINQSGKNTTQTIVWTTE